MRLPELLLLVETGLEDELLEEAEELELDEELLEEVGELVLRLDDTLDVLSPLVELLARKLVSTFLRLWSCQATNLKKSSQSV